MNPHRLTWDFAYNMPFAMLVGGATLLGTVAARDRQPIPWDREMILTAVLLAYFAFTTFLAWAPTDAWQRTDQGFEDHSDDIRGHDVHLRKERIRYLMLVVVGSIGYYGFKGGLWS